MWRIRCRFGGENLGFWLAWFALGACFFGETVFLLPTYLPTLVRRS